MDYPGPQHSDFDNVRSLNRGFLRLLAGLEPAAPPLADLPRQLASRCAALKPVQRDRLAATPFLLFSFRERDHDYWGRLFEPTSGDLLAALGPDDDGRVRLIAAGLGFVWQLAGQNPYAARLICGASLHWCECLAERTLLEVVSAAAHSPDVLMVREAANEPLWRKLLDSGVSGHRDVRKAAHISALQAVLTSGGAAATPRLRLAARAGLAPSLRVADETDR